MKIFTIGAGAPDFWVVVLVYTHQLNHSASAAGPAVAIWTAPVVHCTTGAQDLLFSRSHPPGFEPHAFRAGIPPYE
jgi:hypothetical protein